MRSGSRVCLVPWRDISTTLLAEFMTRVQDFDYILGAPNKGACSMQGNAEDNFFTFNFLAPQPPTEVKPIDGENHPHLRTVPYMHVHVVFTSR